MVCKPVMEEPHPNPLQSIGYGVHRSNARIGLGLFLAGNLCKGVCNTPLRHRIISELGS